MNEKILELLTKEGFLDSDGDPVTDFKPRHLVDLIETVVRECAKVANENVGAFTPGCGNSILEHFGVEE